MSSDPFRTPLNSPSYSRTHSDDPGVMLQEKSPAPLTPGEPDQECGGKGGGYGKSVEPGDTRSFLRRKPSADFHLCAVTDGESILRWANRTWVVPPHTS